MVTDHETPRDHPFGGFTMVTEPMPDGRDIHYYEWPDEPADAPGSDAAGGGAVGDGEASDE